MPAAAKRKPPTKRDVLVDRERLLTEFNMITMEELATLFGVDVRTLQNRPDSKLPTYSKVGGQRLFFKDDVVAFMRKNAST